jgi:hypothetical protein
LRTATTLSGMYHLRGRLMRAAVIIAAAKG